MTIDEDKIIPKPREGESQSRYYSDLIYQLENNYQELSKELTGLFSGSVLANEAKWTPSLVDSATGMIDYARQTGWAFRQGDLVDIWYDIEWTSVAMVAGTIILKLPYRVMYTSNMPFVGVVQPSAITFTGGTEIVLNAVSDTFTAEFWNTGSGFTTAKQNMVASGRLIGNLRYIGKTDE